MKPVFNVIAIPFMVIMLAGSAVAGETLTGSFSGLSGHATSGDVALVKSAGGWVIRMKDNFSFDGAPAPSLGFGRDGEFDSDTNFISLDRLTGAQSYPVPDDIDPTGYDEIYVWCADYAVALGVAKLK